MWITLYVFWCFPLFSDDSVSNDGMKVVNPMETIQEGVESLSPNQFSSPYSQSRCGSLLSSPDSRHRLVQTLNGSMLSKANSILDGLVNTDTSRYDLHRQLSAASTRLAPLLKGDNTDETCSVIITMEGEDCHKEQDKGAVLENPALARVRDVEDSSSRDRSSSVNNRKHAFKVSTCSESKLAESIAESCGEQSPLVLHPMSTSLTAETLQELANNSQSHSAPQTPDGATSTAERHSSSSSVESLPSFSNQSTVTSITPLLQNDQC